ncbi:hypothetical protein F3Y22_tig00112411pilonHSYRG00152 [Hibiscus syriacus]|uniref:COBRA C-terminal domain-containing protein n=1 Tax=Hibiscus syriacus TaxID=106335 RepID=A0A6A2WZZ0_HIBSY|nr:hypothetical protein F3Y22_tig00112411pilonHSYRG00152 [Hibiscus syriacus]
MCGNWDGIGQVMKQFGACKELRPASKETALASKEMSDSAGDNFNFNMPEKFTIGVQGYTCAAPVQVAPIKYNSNCGHRWTQVLGRYSSDWRSSVVLALFFSWIELKLTMYACMCVLHGHGMGLFLVPSAAAAAKDCLEENVYKFLLNTVVVATNERYESGVNVFGEVKITVHDHNNLKNYSEWNLVALHPNLKSLVQVFSFNYEPVSQYGFISGGNVQTEMLLHKDADMFSFREGWGYPRRTLSNGDECVMPPPDGYPMLPSMGDHGAKLSVIAIFFSLLLAILCA